MIVLVIRWLKLYAISIKSTLFSCKSKILPALQSDMLDAYLVSASLISSLIVVSFSCILPRSTVLQALDLCLRLWNKNQTMQENQIRHGMRGNFCGPLLSKAIWHKISPLGSDHLISSFMETQVLLSRRYKDKIRWRSWCQGSSPHCPSCGHALSFAAEGQACSD